MWPPTLLRFNALWFFLWNYSKHLVYHDWQVNTVKEFQNPVENNCDVIRGHQVVIFDTLNRESWVGRGGLSINQMGTIFHSFVTTKSSLLLLDFSISFNNNSNVAISILLCKFYRGDFWEINFFGRVKIIIITQLWRHPLYYCNICNVHLMQY